MERCQRLMAVGYVPLLRTVIDGGTMWNVLAEKHDLSRMTAQRFLNTLHRLRMVHVDRWVRRDVGRRTELTPWFVFGPGPDAPWPGEGTSRVSRRGKLPIELLAFVKAIESLQEAPRHGRELADETGMSASLARGVIAALHQHRLAFIEDYMRRDNAGLGYPLWRFGVDQADKKKPAPKSAKALWTKHNAKKKQRREQARLLRVLVTGSPKRKSLAANDIERAAA